MMFYNSNPSLFAKRFKQLGQEQEKQIPTIDKRELFIKLNRDFRPPTERNRNTNLN